MPGNNKGDSPLLFPGIHIFSIGYDKNTKRVIVAELWDLEKNEAAKVMFAERLIK